MIVVTGAAGFIGSNIVHGLNRRGEHGVVAVDLEPDGHSSSNLAGARFQDYLSAEALLEALASGGLRPTAVLHQGACSDTMERDERLMMDRNLRYPSALLELCLRHAIPLVYASSASVYGLGQRSRENPANEAPINLYARSKLAFDQRVRRLLPDARSTVVGLRYFNVYGPREANKGRMASMVHQLWHQLETTGQARLFEGTDGYGPGEQRRDFVHVDDVVEVNLRFMQGPARRGIFNVGTGQARSFNAVARAIIALQGRGEIRYLPFPDELRGRYQSFTQADLSALRAALGPLGFGSVEQGIAASFGGAPRALDLEAAPGIR